ncbi:hypothetical protein BSKO_00889 [Bryopsis sp. KO-2023]|nr:hypothetical protein BSKO_00889 [Bryopsis sp. KO-2023]
MDVLNAMASCSDAHLKAKVEHALNILKRACVLYSPEHVAMSFNGGKDSTVLLHLLRAALTRYGAENGGIIAAKSFIFFQPNDFIEIRDFAHEMDRRYSLNLDYLEGPFKEGLEKYIANNQIKAVVLGTRRGDPNAPGQGFFCPSSDGWPPFMRINPILDWSYQDVWAFLRLLEVPYCRLYNMGYTSVGGTNNTHPNNALLKEDGTFAPAYLLADSRLERSCRAMVSRAPSDSAGHTRNAGIIAIGDELLSGEVEDTNTNANFLCQELKSIGWRVQKVVFVGDDIRAIAEEVRSLSASCDLVITSGGVGPTLDDVTMDGIARAMDASLARHPVLEERIRGHFGENVTEAHLKMAEAPNGIEIIDAPAGKNGAGCPPPPFPLFRCGNVYVFPGAPQGCREKWGTLKKHLVEGELLPPFHTVVIKLSDAEDIQEGPILDTVAEEIGVDVELSRHPISNQEDNAGMLVCLESNDKTQLEAAYQILKGRLPPDSILKEEKQVNSWIHGRGSGFRLNSIGVRTNPRHGR